MRIHNNNGVPTVDRPASGTGEPPLASSKFIDQMHIFQPPPEKSTKKPTRIVSSVFQKISDISIIFLLFILLISFPGRQSHLPYLPQFSSKNIGQAASPPQPDENVPTKGSTVVTSSKASRRKKTGSRKPRTYATKPRVHPPSGKTITDRNNRFSSGSSLQRVDSLPVASKHSSTTISEKYDLIAFYEPVNSKPSRQKTGRSSPDFSIDKPTDHGRSALAQRKIRIFTHLAQRHGGFFHSILDHNGDYFKVKLFVATKQADVFKKEVAKKFAFVSFSTISDQSTKDKTCIILETHSQ